MPCSSTIVWFVKTGISIQFVESACIIVSIDIILSYPTLSENSCNKCIANTCSMLVVIKDMVATESSMWLKIKCRHLDVQKERENIIILFIQGRGSCISIL